MRQLVAVASCAVLHCLFAALIFPGVVRAQTAGGVESKDGRHVLVDIPHEIDGEPVVAFEIDDGGGADVGHVPDGWASEPTGNGFRISGSPLGEDEGKFRLDIPDDLLWNGSSITLITESGSRTASQLLPPSEYPELKVDTEASVGVLAPAEASTGELVRLEITNEDLLGIGEWTVAGMPVFAADDSPYLQSRIPPSLRPGDFASVRFKNEYGLETIADNEAILIVGTTDADGNGTAPPSLTGCTPRVFVGRTACICGSFPTQEIQNGLMIDGQPLGSPGTASTSVVYVEIPDSIAPGTHTITGAGIDGSIEIVVLAARGEIDLEVILEGGSTPLRVIIEGTTEQLQIRLENRNPEIIVLEGGDEQVVTSTGGELNMLERTVTGIAPGAFDVYYALDEDPCPCLGEGILIAEDDPIGPSRPRDPAGNDSTQVRPPWWPEEDDGDDPRDAPPPEIFGEEEDPNPEMCCGFKGPILVWPQTTDPLVPSDPMVAPHHAAVGAHQVNLASGAFFHNDRDLTIDAVGIPFDFTRHFSSDVETMEGGFAGYRWDFIYNKRLVAMGRDYAKGLRGQIVDAEDSVVMLFDGMGRVLRYAESSSDTRDVLNFGVEAAFRAYVTTYESPKGEFNELQRYVVFDPEKHPFNGHGDVDEGESIFYVLRFKNGVRYIYNCRGQIIHILDTNDYASLPAGETAEKVRFTFRYQGSRNPLTQSKVLSSIEDPSGHFYGVKTVDIDDGLVNTNDDCIHVTGTFPIPRISRVSGAGVEVNFVYKDKNTPILSAIRRVFKSNAGDSLAVETHYDYDGDNRLLSVTTPKEVAGEKRAYIVNKYDKSGRVVNQQLAGKQYATITYGDKQATVSSPVGVTFQYTLEKKGEYYVMASEQVSGKTGSWTTTFKHNDATQVTQSDLPRGNRIIYQYDTSNSSVTEGLMRNDVGKATYHNDLSLGNLTGVTKHPGSITSAQPVKPLSTTTEYEPLYNQTAKVVDANGNETTFDYEYDRQGILGNTIRKNAPNITQADGTIIVVNAIEYDYTDKGQLKQEALSPIDITEYAYDDTGYLSSISSLRGNQTFTHDLYGKLTRWSGPEGTVHYDHDLRGLVVEQVYDPFGFANKQTYEYDLDGNLTRVDVEIKDNFSRGESLVAGVSAPPSSNAKTRSITTEFDLIGRPLSETTSGDGLTFKTSRSFDELGRIVGTTEPSPAGGELSSVRTLDDRGYLLSETRAGIVTTNTYDRNGNLLTTTTGTGDKARKYAYHYDVFDRLIKDINPIGTETRLTLDANGNTLVEEVVGSTGSQEGGTATLEKIVREYNELDQLISSSKHVLNDEGATSDEQYFYDNLLHLRRIVRPGNSSTHINYDDAGRVVEEVSPTGNKILTEYDEFGRSNAIVEIEQEAKFDPSTRQWSFEEKTYRTTLTYDVVGRVKSSAAPGATAAYRYNSRGQKRLVAIQNAGLTETQYDGLGREAVVIAGGRTDSMTYNVAGQMVEFKSAHVHQSWKFNAQGLEVESVDMNTGARTTIERDAIGNPHVVTDPNGTKITRTFNGVGLPVQEDIALGFVQVDVGGQKTVVTYGPRNVWRRYDGLGRLRYAQNGDDVGSRDTGVGFEYDGLGRVTRETQAGQFHGQTLERSYSTDNSWSEVRYPEILGSPVVRTSYDKGGRIVRVDLDKELLASYVYSGPQRIAGRSLRNGSLEVISYDDLRRIEYARVWSEVDRTPTIIWSARATYTKTGRLETVSSFDQARASSSITSYRYDDKGRKIESTTVSSVAGAKPSQTTSQLLTSFEGTRPKIQAEILIDTQGEKPTPVFARIQEYTYDKSRVSSVETTARNKFTGTVPDDILTPADVSTWVQGDDLFTDTQTFLYDPAGNLIKDDANVYNYDAYRNLTRIAQIPGNRPYNQALVFDYDPIGRRVSATPWRDRVPVGFVDWAPWNRSPETYFYDGPNVIGESVQVSGEGTFMLARYFLGARPGERVRMDRKVDENPTGSVTPFYFHGGLQSQIAIITDGNGVSRTTFSPSSSQAGSAVAPPDEMRLITGSRTRNPYLGWSTRIDGFSGLKYDEQTSKAIYDYRTSTRVSDAMDMAAYRQNITAFQNRGAIALAVVTMAAIAPGAAAFEGLLNVGLNWFAAYWTESPYTPAEAGEHFAEGVLSGGLGKLVPGGSTAISKYASDYVTDFTAGVAFDVGYHNRSWGDAVADNVVGAAASASLATGLRLGFAAGRMGVSYGRAAYHARTADNIDTRASANPTAFSIHHPKRNVSGQVFEGVLEGRFRSAAENGFQAEVLHMLLNGRAYHRHVARLILRGRLTVHWDANMTAHGEWSKHNATAIYLNPSSFRKHPNSALEAASTIVHEATHALGGGEPAAFLAQGQFIHFWYNVKQRRRATDVEGGGRYDFSRSTRRILAAYQWSQITKTPDPLYNLLKGYRSYGAKHKWFERHDEIFMNGQLHRQIFLKGGWGKVLHLDPELQRRMEQDVIKAGAWTI